MQCDNVFAANSSPQTHHPQTKPPKKESKACVIPAPRLVPSLNAHRLPVSIKEVTTHRGCWVACTNSRLPGQQASINPQIARLAASSAYTSYMTSWHLYTHRRKATLILPVEVLSKMYHVVVTIHSKVSHPLFVWLHTWRDPASAVTHNATPARESQIQNVLPCIEWPSQPLTSGYYWILPQTLNSSKIPFCLMFLKTRPGHIHRCLRNGFPM